MKFKNSLSILVILLIFVATVKAQSPGDIKLQSATDKSQFILSKEKGKYVALHFLLKTECPYCIRHTSEYFGRAATLPNVVQVFIKPDTEKEIAEWATPLLAAELTKFPVYRDPDAQLATQFNIPNGYSFHNQIVHYPAMVLIGPDGKEVFRYIGKNNTDRFSFDQLVSKVHELSGK